MVLSFSGIDGSGKSTLAAAVKAEHPGFEMLNIFHFRLVNRICKKNSALTRKAKNPKKGKRWIGFVNLFLLFFDILLFRCYLFFSRKPVICDRYFYDVLAVHIYRYGNSGFVRLLNVLIPRPAVAFLIEADIQSAQKREVGGAHTIEYLNALKEIYDAFSEEWRFRRIRNENIQSSGVEINQIVNRILHGTKQS